MRVRRGAFAGVVVSVVVAGCAIPDDDNPHEPRRRPEASLVIADWSPAGGECPVDPLPPGTGVAVAPIGHCLVLDARGSADPGGGPLRYRFDGPGVSIETDSQWLPIPRLARLALARGEFHTFKVTVRDRDGNEHEALAPIVVTNTRPEVHVGVGRSLPEGGYPWAFGEPFAVRLGAEASDADGDPVRLCWTAPEVPETCGDPGAAAFEIGIPVDAGRYAVAVRAFDEVDYSLPEYVDVTVARPPVWARGTGALTRLDPSWRSYPGTTAWHGGAALLESSSGTVLARTIPGGMLELQTWPEGAPIDVLPIDFTAGVGSVGLQSIALADAARGRVWIASLEATLGQSVRFVGQAYTVGSAGTLISELVPATSAGSESVPDAELGSEVIASLGSGGTLWLGRTEGDTVAGIDATGEAWMCDLGGGNVSGIAKRPGHEETWATAYGLAAESLLVRLDRGCAFESFRLPAAIATGLGFVDSTLLWVATADRGALLLDLSAVLDGKGEGAVVRALSEVQSTVWDGGKMRVEPSSGTFWVPTGGVTWEVPVSGEPVQHEGYVAPGGWDAATGRVVFNLADLTVASGVQPSASGVLTRSPVAVTPAAGLDWATAGAWARGDVDSSTTILLRVDQAGRFVDSFAGLLIDDQEVGLPHLVDLHTSPDGRWLWGRGDLSALTGDPLNVYAIEIADAAGELAVPVGRRNETVGSANVDDIVALLPLAPVTDTSGRLAWVLSDDRISLLDGADPSFELLRSTVPGVLTAGARSLASNDLCFISAASIANPTSLFLGRLSASGGMPQTLATVPADALNASMLVTASSDPEHDACWFSWSVSGFRQLRAIAADGTTLHQALIAPTATDLLSDSPHAVLVNDAGSVRYVEFERAVGGGEADSRVLVPSTHPAFIQR